MQRDFLRSSIPSGLSAVLVLLCGLPGAYSQDKSTTESTRDLAALMHGEKVLSAAEAPLLNPICRFEEHPWFEISNLRPGRLLSTALEVDFVCSGPLEGQFHLVVLTNGKRFRFPMSVAQLSKRRDSFTCSYSSITDRSPFGADLEAYVELTDAEPVRRTSRYSRTTSQPVDPLFFKVSKSATRGEVTAITYSRAIRASERKLYSARRKKYGPPPPPPAGIELVQGDTRIVAGAPVLAAHEGDWLRAEVLAVADDGKLTVHWPHLGHLKNKVLERSHVGLAAETIRKLATEPESFTPSVELPLGSLQPPPPGFVVVPDDVKLLPGVPVKVGSWDYTVLLDGTGEIPLLYRGSDREYPVARRSIVISKSTLEAMSQPGAAEQYAARLKQARTPKTTTLPSGPGSTYRIDIEVPSDHERVTAETPLKAETRCQACWARRWNPVVVKSLYENGDVGIIWTSWSSSRIYRVTRDSLIIAKETLTKLAADSDKPTPTKKPSSSGTTDDPPNAKYTLSLLTRGDSPIPLIKTVMAIADLDFATSAKAVRELPLELKRGLSKEEAADWQAKFEAAGATVKVELTK